jgi:P27 family predicted phage terminase small subunit
MAKGRPKDATAAKRGTSHRSEAVKPPEGLVVAVTPEQQALLPPAGLPEAAHILWRIAVEELCALRTLHESDLPLLEMMVTAAYRHRQAQAHIERLGLMVAGLRGPMLNPMLRLEKDEAASYLRLAETLGLTPVARLRLGLIKLAGASLLAGIDAELGIQVRV